MAATTASQGVPVTPAKECSQLKITLRAGGVYNADTYTLIDFTNKSNANCTLRGIPALDLLTETGLSIPTDIAPDSSASAARAVTLVPGGTAYARLTAVTNVKSYPAAQCKPETSAFIAVEPGSPAPPMIPFKVMVCTTSYVNVLSIASFAPGTGPYVYG